MIFEFGLRSIIAHSQRNITVQMWWSSSMLTSVSLISIYFVILSQKHDSQYATELPALKITTLIIFKYRTQHTEVIYAHQASIFRAIEARETRIIQLFPLFCSKDQNKLCTHGMRKVLARLWVGVRVCHFLLLPFYFKCIDTPIGSSLIHLLSACCNGTAMRFPANSSHTCCV